MIISADRSREPSSDSAAASAAASVANPRRIRVDANGVPLAVPNTPTHD